MAEGDSFQVILTLTEEQYVQLTVVLLQWKDEHPEEEFARNVLDSLQFQRVR
jgi:hypothetical protein